MATTDKIRNITLIGQSGTGKTLLFDTLLYNTKMVSRCGRVEDNSSNSDFTDEEHEKKHSIFNAVGYVDYRGYKINIIDTPGYPDFIGDPISSFHAADITVSVISAVEGVQFTHRNFSKMINKIGLSRIAFINKMDRDDADFDATFAQVKKMVKSGAMPLTIPVGSGTNFSGVVNILSMKALTTKDGTIQEMDIPDDIQPTADKYRKAMIEAIAESDDALMEKYLESEMLSDEEIHTGLTNGLSSGKIIAVLCGSAEKNIGLQSLLDIIVDAMPSPILRTVRDTNDALIKIGVDKPFLGFVFKTLTERNVGELNFVRVYSGSLKSGDHVSNTNKNASERIGTLSCFIGKEKKDITTLVAGDIGILVKLKNTTVCDTLAEAKSSVIIKKPAYPKPILSMAIVPPSKQDQERMSGALHKLMGEDATLSMHFDSELKQSIVSCMGEQQMDNLVHTLKTKFDVSVTLEEPKVPYRETISRKVEAQGRHKKQSGGRGQFGDCFIRWEPLKDSEKEDPDQVYLFVNEIKGGAIPKNYIPAVDKGVHEALNRGFLSGCPMINVKATVYDGSYHAVDSSDLAFQMAAILSFKAAMPNAGVNLLEPIMNMKISILSEYMGDVMGNLSGRRGRIQGQEKDDDLTIINALCPLAELYKYANDLRSITQGTGHFEMEFSHYEQVPPDVAKKIVEAAAKEKEEEA